jgi:Response regulator containing a CheY-like receiver domain and an HTH DNA-binding domain
MPEPGKTITVGVAEDHLFTLKGLNALLEELPQVEVEALCQTANEVYTALEQHPELDVFIMDIKLQDALSGITLTQYITAHHPKTRVLALTMNEELSHIRQMIQAGARGYLLKNTTLEEVREALKILHSGGEYYCSRVGEVILEDILRDREQSEAPQPERKVKLSPREQQVLELVGQELSTQEIADRLEISARTVENHRRNLVNKVGARNTIGLIKYAIRNGYI